jgi:hypothetical protein
MTVRSSECLSARVHKDFDEDNSELIRTIDLSESSIRESELLMLVLGLSKGRPSKV